MNSINILKVLIAGIFLTVSALSMELLDEYKNPTQPLDLTTIPIVPFDLDSFVVVCETNADNRSEIEAIRSEFESLRTSLCVSGNSPPSTSYRALELLLQSVLYTYCDPKSYKDESWKPQGETKPFWLPEEAESRNRQLTEETNNLQYSLSPSAQKPFSQQPRRADLKHCFGPEIEAWHKRKQAEIDGIKTTWKNLKSWMDTKPGYLYTKDDIERNVKALEFAYQALLRQFARKHGPREVMLGEREPNEDEIKALELKLNPKTPQTIITKASGLRTSAIGTPYCSPHLPEIVKALQIPEDELPRFYEELLRRKNVSQREYNIWSEIWLMYTKNFLLKVKGLLNFGNWAFISGVAEEFRKQIEIEIDQKYPSATHPTEKDMTLETIENQRKLKQKKLEEFLSEIRKFPRISSQPVEGASDDRFQRVYGGLDEMSQVESTSLISTMFQTQKTFVQRYINDEERFDIQVMWDTSSEDSLTNLETYKIGLFIKDDGTLCCKIKNCDEAVLDLWISDADFKLRLVQAITKKIEPSPQDRRKLLDVLKQYKYIKQKQETIVRQYHNDEERFEIQVMWKNPSERSLAELGANKIGLFLRGDHKLCCKTNDCNEISLDPWIFNGGFKDSLILAVKQNRQPSPADRVELLNILKRYGYIKREIEKFNVPYGTQMCTTFPAVQEVMHHRKVWNEKQKVWNETEQKFDNLSVFDQLNWYQEDVSDYLLNRPRLKPTFAYGNAYKELYEELYQEHTTLLFGNPLRTGFVKLLFDMYQPYTTSPTRVPRGWKFVIATTYEKPSVKPEATKRLTIEGNPSPNRGQAKKDKSENILYVDLHDQNLSENDIEIREDGTVLSVKLESKGEVVQEDSPVVTFNTGQDLSGNQNIGKALKCEIFSTERVVKLQLSDNVLTNIDFVAHLPNLKYFDVSSNVISDITALGNCVLLTYLDLSNNEVEILLPLATCPELRTLKANKNRLIDLKPSTFPIGLNNVEVLEVEGNEYVENYSWVAFRAFFFNLKTLKKAGGYSGQIPSSKSEDSLNDSH